MCSVTDDDKFGFETRSIRSGNGSLPQTSNPAVSPIFLSSTFIVQDIASYGDDYAYSRVSNPNRSELASCIARLEGGKFGYAFISGLAAEDAVLRVLCGPGSHIVVSRDIYGGTFRLIKEVLERWHVTFTAVDMTDLASVARATTKETALIWVESVSNPMLRVPDIGALAVIAQKADARLIVDNTFASPYLVQPLSLGADVVVHSTTKYLGGHSDVVGGAVVLSDPALNDMFELHVKTMGTGASAADSWLTLRGIKTLAVRMERHCDNAESIARFLSAHPSVASVSYPGLEDHPDSEIAVRQMRRFGGMVSFRPRAGVDAAVRFCEATTLFGLAVSLGGVESLVELPARMTHRSSVGSMCAAPEDLVRLSVGLESSDDLIADLESALTIMDGAGCG